MVIFHSYVNVYQRVSCGIACLESFPFQSSCPVLGLIWLELFLVFHINQRHGLKETPTSSKLGKRSFHNVEVFLIRNVTVPTLPFPPAFVAWLLPFELPSACGSLHVASLHSNGHVFSFAKWTPIFPDSVKHDISRPKWYVIYISQCTRKKKKLSNAKRLVVFPFQPFRCHVCLHTFRFSPQVPVGDGMDVKSRVPGF